MTLPIEIGQRFGSLTALEIRPGSRLSPRRIYCLCDCGEFYLATPHSLRRGITVRCFACLPKRKTAEEIKFRRRLNNYQHSAARKKLTFTFSAERFRDFYEASCFYCGVSPARGIDRRDNSLGYVEGNCVPACAQCNYAKRNSTEQDFLNWIARIAAHQGLSL